MRIFLPIHLNGDNRGCEAITKGTAELLGLSKEQLICLSTNIETDKKLGIDKISTLQQSHLSFFFRLIRKIVKHLPVHIDWQEATYHSFYGKFLKQIKKDDVMLSTGGDMLCYSNNQVIYTNNYVHERGIKTILWGCSIGKENLTPEKLDTLRKFSIIYVRESLTEQLLRSLNINNVVRFPDPAFILKAEETMLPDVFSDQEVIGINISNFVLNSNGFQSAIGKDFIKLINHIINETQLHILLIPHVLWKGQDDRIACDELLKYFNETNRISVLDSSQLTYSQIRFVISKCRFFIGARTHSMISAYSMCVPSIAIGYSIKSRGIAKDLGLSEELIINSKDYHPGDFQRSFTELKNHEMEIRHHLELEIPRYVEQLQEVNKIIY